MAIVEKSALAEKFSKLTGLTYNIDGLIADCSTEKEKVDMFKKLSWDIKRGLILGVPAIGELYAEVLLGLADALGVDVSLDDVDYDGDVDAEDQKIKDDIADASEIKVVTAAPTTEAPVIEAGSVDGGSEDSDNGSADDTDGEPELNF